MRLKEITISAFRGFNEKQTLNLDNNIILIKGSNGSGKSSLVEAIEWLFFDEISRKKKSLCKSEYSGEFLRNIHSSKEQETFVELLVDIEGKEVLLKKMLLSPEKKEYYANGSFVDDFSCLGVSSADVYKPILSQVEVKHYVETDPKDRYEETNKILGLGILAELRTDLQELQKLKKVDSKYQISRKIYDGLECDLKELAFENLWIEMARRPFLEKAFENSLIETITKIYSVEFTSIEKLGETLDKEFKKLAQISDNSEIAQMTMSSNKSILKLPSLLIEEIKQLSELLKQLKPVKAELYSFLETGKDLIVEMTCPFCQEKTLTPEKRKELDTRIHSLQEAGIVLSNARSQISKICLLKDEFNGQHQIFPDISSLEKIAASHDEAVICLGVIRLSALRVELFYEVSFDFFRRYGCVQVYRRRSLLRNWLSCCRRRCFLFYCDKLSNYVIAVLHNGNNLSVIASALCFFREIFRLFRI